MRTKALSWRKGIGIGIGELEKWVADSYIVAGAVAEVVVVDLDLGAEYGCIELLEGGVPGWRIEDLYSHLSQEWFGRARFRMHSRDSGTWVDVVVLSVVDIAIGLFGRIA